MWEIALLLLKKCWLIGCNSWSWDSQCTSMMKKVKRHNDDEKKLCSGGDSGVKPALISREVSQEPANQQTSVPTAFSMF